MNINGYHPGDTISWDNDTGSDVANNSVVLIPGDRLGVAVAAITNGTTGPVVVSGVIRLASAAVTIVADDPLYATLGASPAVTNVPTSTNYFIGWAEKDAASAAGALIRLAPFAQAPIAFQKQTPSVTSSASAITLTAGSFKTVIHAVIASAAGTQAVATPALAEGIMQGQLLFVKKTGSAGAVTITAGTGTTILGNATLATLDAQNDKILLIFIGTDWIDATTLIA